MLKSTPSSYPQVVIPGLAPPFQAPTTPLEPPTLPPRAITPPQEAPTPPQEAQIDLKLSFLSYSPLLRGLICSLCSTAIPGAQLSSHLSRHHRAIPLLDRQDAENVAKTLDLAPLGDLPYLKGPREPLPGLEIHQNGRICLKCPLNEALNPQISTDRAAMSTHLRNTHQIHRSKEVGTPKPGVPSPVGLYWREGVTYQRPYKTQQLQGAFEVLLPPDYNENHPPEDLQTTLGKFNLFNFFILFF